MSETTAPPDFMLAGGPLHRLESRFHLDKLRTRIGVALAITWVPLILLGAIEQLVTGRMNPILRDLSLHVRLLIAVPLTLLAEVVLIAESGRSFTWLVEDGFVPAAVRPRLAELVRKTTRLGNARAPELTILLLALLAGVTTFTGWISPTGAIGREEPAALSAPRVWYGLVALPLFLFLNFRALFRWLIWVRTLIGLARLPLDLAPGHPDRRAGIGFLKKPSLAFHGLFLFAQSCVLCAAWANQILAGDATIQQLKHPFAAFALTGEVLAFAPLLVFVPKLFTAGRAGRRAYEGLATDYVQRFHARWMSHRPRVELLGTPDLQSLADLNSAYHDSVELASPILFTVRDLGTLLAVMLLPAFPLLLLQMPVDAVLLKLGGLLLGAH